MFLSRDLISWPDKNCNKNIGIQSGDLDQSRQKKVRRVNSLITATHKIHNIGLLLTETSETSDTSDLNYFCQMFKLSSSKIDQNDRMFISKRLLC